MQCPCCGGSQTRKKSVLFAQESSHVNLHGFVHNEPVALRGQQYSKLAQEVAPPRRFAPWKPGLVKVLAGLGLLLTLGIFLQWVAFLLIAWGLLELIQSLLKMAASNRSYTANRRYWERCWYCLSCGSTFELY